MFSCFSVCCQDSSDLRPELHNTEGLLWYQKVNAQRQMLWVVERKTRRIHEPSTAQVYFSVPTKLEPTVVKNGYIWDISISFDQSTSFHMFPYMATIFFWQVFLVGVHNIRRHS